VPIFIWIEMGVPVALGVAVDALNWQVIAGEDDVHDIVIGALKPPIDVAIIVTAAEDPEGSENTGLGVPVSVKAAGTELVFARENRAAVATPGALTCTVNVPVRLSATGVGDVANPAELPVTVEEKVPPNAAVAPEEGAVNVTFAPGLELP
jgi:hypothetical protein